MIKQDINITIAQVNPIVGDIAGNSDMIISVLSKLPEGEIDLMVFPEMVLSGYPAEDLVLKPSFMDYIHAAVDLIVEASKDLGTAILLPTPWRESDKIYNAALLIDNGQIVAKQFKHELPNYGVFDEVRVFAQGPLPSPIDFRGHKLGVLICEDMWYPAVASHLESEGAEILICVNGSPFDLDKREARFELAQQRIDETGLPLVYVNLVGGQDELVFDGASFVMNNKGELCYELEHFIEQLYWFNFPLAMEPIKIVHEPFEEKCYKAVTLGLRDYVIKNNFPGVIIGMSGGIDSALSAVIAVDALGPENVRLVMMPSPFTSEESLEDAKACAEALETSYEIIDIEPAMKAYESMIDGLSGVAHENMQSRARGLTLMALSNETGAMVLTTGNKSEVAIGYATLYGDMCGGFNALKDLYKTQVYALSEWRNSLQDEDLIPQNIISKAPTAELRPDQKDQDSLPEYKVLDEILESLIEEELSIEDIVALGHDRDVVLKVARLLDIAEYKRRQAAPGTKISSKAFGKDRRYPITNRFVSNLQD